MESCHLAAARGVKLWFVSSQYVSIFSVSSKISDPESHAHHAFVNVVAVALNIVNAVNTCTRGHQLAGELHIHHR